MFEYKKLSEINWSQNEKGKKVESRDVLGFEEIQKDKNELVKLVWKTIVLIKSWH